eukprot:2291615-Amphidinium_carterae.2
MAEPILANAKQAHCIVLHTPSSKQASVLTNVPTTLRVPLPSQQTLQVTRQACKIAIQIHASNEYSLTYQSLHQVLISRVRHKRQYKSHGQTLFTQATQANDQAQGSNVLVFLVWLPASNHDHQTGRGKAQAQQGAVHRQHNTMSHAVKWQLKHGE